MEPISQPTKQSTPPDYTPPSPESVHSVVTPSLSPQKKKSLVLPIILMAWPAVLVIGSIILYAIINFIFASQAAPAPSSNDTSLFSSDQNGFRTATNVILFFIGALGTGIGPISFIVGLVLLIKRASHKTE